ncbi:DNA topoisomerase I, type IA [Syntrophomonas zehnderi OL-4]|uniref:DNA topoisomerase 1 n=1 Tax=Syntrophomonas zehnderi OL-4 TaxID=690567 RepID=A0A0E4GAQ4_9FIRM|nr:type I DNA topoisomerase [Syntrophomonas zehnderi]CFX64035.1 DNA topoisomerase I, type IA [Syntrophomonas zehnderi OL-4]
MAETTLVIVESAAKAKTIGKFLGKNYKVKASVGHIKDLPKSKLGIDVENNFEPQYITIRGKGDLLKEIKSEASKVDRVLLATDPDREGEAIAWHLQNAMKIPDGSNCRIEFNEITKDAIKQALKKSRPIDMDRVNAQQARRVLDRLVGYNLSPLLWAKVRKGLSAGRVQSVAVKMICDREKEIQAFTPEEYWTIETQLKTAKNESFTAKVNSYKGEKLEINSAAAKDTVLEYLQKSKIKTTNIERKEKRKKPHPPFITSTLQQEASKRLNFFSNRTMRVAQELYEGLAIGKEGTVGLITYLRTDSTRIATEAQNEALGYIKDNFGGEYAPETPNQYKGRKSAQDAHEAIRPSSVGRTPDSIKEYLSRDQYRLYKLIWERFVASQMTPALYDTIGVEIQAGDYGLRAHSSQLKFPGYKKIYTENDEEEIKNPIPQLKIGQILKLDDIIAEQHFTQPPPRYTEASLVKLLEEKSIGRPSTYAPIIDTILKRHYAERQNKQFVPTELGFIVVELLDEHFGNIMDVDFTAKMEEDLDMVEEGELDWKLVVRDFYGPFKEDLDKAQELIEKIEIKDEEAGKDCPQCGKPMLIKYGRFGKFVACSGFPECRYTESLNEEVGVNCPLCNGPIIALKSKKGRRYYGCKNYPDCEFRSWNKPTGEKCSVCGDAMVEKTNRAQEIQIICQNPQCKQVKQA